MSAMKVIGMKLLRIVPNVRAFATKATRPLQGKKKKKETVMDKESCDKAIEAANAVKEGAKEVRATGECLKDIASSTSKDVNKMTTNVSKKVTETSDAVTGKSKRTVAGAVGTAKEATDFVKGKVSKK